MWAKIASLLMFLAVAFGSFGAHDLRGRLDAYSMDVFKTAVLYHMVHALGLFAVAWLSTVSADPKINLAGIFMLAGIVIFSGSLYVLSVTGIKAFGAITPIGGLSFLTAWVLIALARV